MGYNSACVFDVTFVKRPVVLSDYINALKHAYSLLLMNSTVGIMEYLLGLYFLSIMFTDSARSNVGAPVFFQIIRPKAEISLSLCIPCDTIYM